MYGGMIFVVNCMEWVVGGEEVIVGVCFIIYLLVSVFK